MIPVIMAGGTGSRLWPLSRSLSPKQFMTVEGSSSMLQATLNRLAGLDCTPSIIITNEAHRFIVAEQISQIQQDTDAIILEPAGRNTAPAVALAAIRALNIEKDPLLLIMAADHVIGNLQAFHKAVEQAAALAESGKLVTFGIVPTCAETGYGYIRAQGHGHMTQPFSTAYPIAEFVEKPDAKTAEQYLKSGEYFWNSGIFMFKAQQYLQELKQHRPDIFAACTQAMQETKEDLHFLRVNTEAFEACPSDSVDYAVMEKTKDGYVIPLEAQWNDIGSWSALWEISQKDENDNVIRGDVIAIDSRGSYINSTDKLVAVIGLEDTVVVNTKDAILVAAKNKVQQVKNVVEQLKKDKRPEHLNHREVYRPWGKYDSVDNGERYQVKRITVKPGAKLSLQMHHHRAEHWIVVSGTARVQKGKESFLVPENESVYIPVGVTHSLENPGKIPLELIEVQSGSYLGEDDIIRFEDVYGRI